MTFPKTLEKWGICNMSGRKKTQGMISLSLEKDCNFENLSKYSQFTFKFSCVVGLWLCNRTLPFILKICDIPLSNCFCLTSPHYTHWIFSHVPSHLERIKHFYHFIIVVDFSIIFLECMLFSSWVKIIQLVIFFPLGETESRLACQMSSA